MIRPPISPAIGIVMNQLGYGSVFVQMCEENSVKGGMGIEDMGINAEDLREHQQSYSRPINSTPSAIAESNTNSGALELCQYFIIMAKG